MEPKRKELQHLAEAGRQWAAGDKHPWETFMTNLHGMFLAVVRARKLKDDELGLPFPVSAQHEKRDTYPWHHFQLPRPRGIPPEITVTGQLPREWKWGPDLLPMVLRWHAESEWLKMPPNMNVSRGHTSRCHSWSWPLTLRHSHGGRCRRPRSRNASGGTRPSRRKAGCYG